MTPHIPIVDATDSIRLSQDDLRFLYEQNLAFIDYETTGLDPDDNAITEVALARVVLEGGQYRVQTFNPFVLPVRPAIREYDAQSGAPYDRKAYEYDISLEALSVTGTEFIRTQPGGPITAARVGGEEKQAFYWHDVAPQMLDFIGDRKLTAYNATFDMGFTAAKLREALGDDLPLPAHVTNDAQLICQMYTFMRHMGQGASNRLEEFRRKMTDPDAGERGAHSGMEDVFIMMEGAVKQLRHYGRPMTIADLYADIVHTADPNAEVAWFEDGGVEIRFSQDPAQLGGKAALLWQFFTDLRDARVRNPNIPHHLEPAQAGDFSVRLRAGGREPLLLNLLKKLMIYDEMLEGGFIESARFHDSTSRVDVTLADDTGRIPAAQRTVYDVPLASLRKSYEYFKTRPHTAAANIELMKTLELTERVGLAIFHESEGRETITIAPYNRRFGSIRVHLPKGRSFADYRNDVLANIRELAPLGSAPGMQGVTAEQGDDLADQPYDSTFGGLIYYSIRLGERSPIQIGVDESLYSTVFRTGGLPEGLKAKPDGEGHMLVSGPLEAIRTYTTMLNDARWILHRLGQVPGTHRVEVRDGAAVLHQNWGTEPEALAALMQAGVAFTATDDRVIVHLDELMADSFQWSKALETATRDVLHNAGLKKPQPLPQPVLALHARLLDGTASRVDVDIKGGVTVFDRQDTPYPMAGGDLAITPGADGQSFLATHSTLSGLAGFSKSPEGDGKVLMHPALAALVQEQLSYRLIAKPLENGQVSVTIPGKDQAAFMRALETSATLLHQLSVAHGLERYPITTAEVQDGMLILHPPASDLFRENHYSGDIQAFLKGLANPANQRQIADILEALPFPSVLGDLRSQDIRQVIGPILKAHAALEAFAPNLGQLLYITDPSTPAAEGVTPHPVMREARDACHRLLHKRDLELGRFDRADHTLRQMRHMEPSQAVELVHEGIYSGKLLVGNIGRSLESIRDDIGELQRLRANPHPRAMPLNRAMAEWLLQHQDENPGYADQASALLFELYKGDTTTAYGILDTHSRKKALEAAVDRGDWKGIEEAAQAMHPLKPTGKKPNKATDAFNAAQQEKVTDLLAFIRSGGDIRAAHNHFADQQLARAVGRVRESLEHLQKSLQYGERYLTSTEETLLNNGRTARRITGFDPQLARVSMHQLEDALTHTGLHFTRRADGAVAVPVADLLRSPQETIRALEQTSTYILPQEIENGFAERWEAQRPTAKTAKGTESRGPLTLGFLRDYVTQQLDILLGMAQPGDMGGRPKTRTSHTGNGKQ